MRILISNDDGYFSPGIGLLAKQLAEYGEVTVWHRSAIARRVQFTDPRPAATVRQMANGSSR
jgi:5'-nucleotidase